jgi:NAD(P)-dependent dehydrogenase (short-subunit alcohol dehydrogenase family)
MIDLHGHTALITGGTQGVGSAIAKSLAAAGCDVILQGLRVNQDALDTISDCQLAGVNATSVYCDLSRPTAECVDLLEQAVHEANANVDLLVNNVGVFIDKPFLEMDEATFDTTFHLNLKLGYFLTQRFARHWIKSKIKGRVLFTGSINGLLAEPTHTAYDASKAAVAGLVRSLCVSLAPHGIRVNSIAPGLVRTPLTSLLDDDPASLDWMKLHTPNGEVPGPEVCGGLAAFLLSDLAEHIHGQTMYVDGGMSAWQQPDVPR